MSFNNEIKIKTTVSSGTYIRSLIDDIGTRLNTYACMTSLKRTSIGNAKIESSIDLDDINIDTPLILDPSIIIDNNISILESNRIEDIKNGKKIEIDSDSQTILLKNGDQLLAIYEKCDDKLYKCKRGLW